MPADSQGSGFITKPKKKGAQTPNKRRKKRERNNVERL